MKILILHLNSGLMLIADIKNDNGNDSGDNDDDSITTCIYQMNIDLV